MFNMSTIILQAYDTIQTEFYTDSTEYVNFMIAFSIPFVMLVFVLTKCTIKLLKSCDPEEYINSLKDEKEEAETLAATYLQMYEDEVVNTHELRGKLEMYKERLHDSEVNLYSIQQRYNTVRDSAKKFLEAFPEKNTCCESKCSDPPRSYPVEFSNNESSNNESSDDE